MLDDARGKKIGVAKIVDRMAERPYGVRAGVAPLLLGVILKLRAHEIGVYENGTFRSTFTGQDLIYVIKGPRTFEQ